MSIAAFIKNPHNETERNFYVPIATENTFKKEWSPIIEKLELSWLPLFSTGVDIKYIDLHDILHELSQFKSHHIESGGQNDITNRLEQLTEFLTTAFMRKSTVVTIG
jgi:hypothetical protein